MLCVKDADGRYLHVNDAFVRRAGERAGAAVVGRRAGELFVPELAERYEEQDAQVLATGTPLRHELELIRRAGGDPGWYLTTKLPILDGGRAIGVVSISEDLRTAEPDDDALLSLTRVVDLVESRLADPPRLAELADAAGCSTATLDRRMRRVFGLSPNQFVLKVRIDHARHLLTDTDLPLADIALACGFYDQPAFSRQFARLSGETPGQYRRRARTGLPPGRGAT
jgi:PAS domain S-box-containing protein